MLTDAVLDVQPGEFGTAKRVSGELRVCGVRSRAHDVPRLDDVEPGGGEVEQDDCRGNLVGSHVALSDELVNNFTG